jgi:hypothetical protein
LVNVTTKKGAPRGAINQLGHFLKCIVHVFAEADDDAVILMAKWDIQDGFSGSSTAATERSGISAIYSHRHQRNYAGWWHKARYKWDGWTLHHILALHQTRQETLQSTLVKQKNGILPKHKFEHWAGMKTALVNDGQQNDKLHYVLEVYVDAVISCIVPTTKRQVKHVAWRILHGIHDVFPPSEDDAKTPSQQKATQRGRHIRNNKMPVGF